MEDWFSVISKNSALSEAAVQDLCELGFVVIPGPLASEPLAQLVAAYDAAVAGAADADVAIGRSTTRINDSLSSEVPSSIAESFERRIQ